MILICFFFFFKQKTAYEMRISDWISDVCSSDLLAFPLIDELRQADRAAGTADIGDLSALDQAGGFQRLLHAARGLVPAAARIGRDEEFQENGRASCRERGCLSV